MSDEKEKMINEMVNQFGYLAMQWRDFHSRQMYKEAESIVKQYHSIFDRLWELGWDGGDLLPDEELPDNLMPKYFIDKWRTK